MNNSSAMFSEPLCAAQNIQCASIKMNIPDNYNDGLNSNVTQNLDCSISLAKFILKNYLVQDVELKADYGYLTFNAFQDLLIDFWQI